MNGMTLSHNVVISGFTPVQMAKHVPQRLTVELSAYGVAKAHCLSNGLNDEQSLRQVYQTVKEKFDRYALSPAQIKQRQLIFFPKLTDIRFGENGFDVADPEPEHAYLKLYDIKDDPNGANIRIRHDSYAKVAEQALERMYEGTSSAPNDVIHVTCTGFLAPNPVERMVSRRAWFKTTVTNCYHMGCYGAFPAIKMAHGMLASAHLGVTPPKQRVDIVHTELFSAHHNLVEWRAENIIAMTLFADGLIKYSLYPEEEARRHGMRGYRILALSENLLPESADTMTGVPGPFQIQMGLSPLVPVVIKRNIKAFVIDLLQRAGLDYEQDKSALNFAVHPGGPKIVEHVQDELALTDDQVVISKQVFHENGNMSSCTIPVILKETLEHVSIGTRIVCLGFGPGLTVAGMVLEKI